MPQSLSAIAVVRIAILSLWLMAPLAAVADNDSGYLSQLRFQIDQNTRSSLFEQQYNLDDVLLPRLHNLDLTNEPGRSGYALQQYDARLFYPVSNIHGVSLDLGINIKYLNAVSSYPQDTGLTGGHNFNRAIPMFYATALFDLPFDGLSASLEGSHRDTDHTRAFDYRAKLQYKWSGGFGLEGGWQHQQYSLDSGQSLPGLEYESKGVFLDLFMDF